MSLFNNKESRRCFVACNQQKIDSGQCACLNNMNQPNKQNLFKIHNKDSVKFIGLKLKDAIDLLEECEESRIVLEDGIPCIITHDLKFNRWNFELENGLIVNANKG